MSTILIIEHFLGTFWAFLGALFLLFGSTIWKGLLNGDVTMIINFENIADDNALFGKVKKKIINFRNPFDTAIGLRVLKIAF